MEGQYIQGTRVGEPVTFGALALGWLTSPSGQAVVTNFVNGLLQSLGFGPGPSRWADAAEGVHDWFTQYGEQKLLDFMQAKFPNAIGSLDQVKGVRQYWLFIGAPGITPAFPVGRIIGTQSGPYTMSSAAKENEFWAAMGVNLPATRQRSDAAGWHDPNNMNPESVVTIANFNGQVDAEIRGTLDTIADGDALTDDQIDIALGLQDESDQERESSQTTALTLLGAAAAAASLLR